MLDRIGQSYPMESVEVFVTRNLKHRCRALSGAKADISLVQLTVSNFTRLDELRDAPSGITY